MNRSFAMLQAVVIKELRQTARDKRMIFMLVAAPVIQLFIFASAVNLDVDHVPTVVVDLDKSARSREDLRQILADGTLSQVGSIESIDEAERWLETRRAAVALLIPAGFESDVTRGRPARVQAILDGSDPNRAAIAQSAVAQYFAGEAETIARQRIARMSALSSSTPAGGTSATASPDVPQPAAAMPSLPQLGGTVRSLPQLATRSRILFNPELETAVYMVPGIVAMLLLVVTTIVTAMGLSRERERGTLEQVMVTPVHSSMLILGKILPFAVFGLVDFGLALVVGSYVFDMPLRGSIAILVFGTLLYLLTTLGMGMLISTLSSTQQQAFMGGLFFMLPAALLSGIMTPIRSMPAWLQPLTLVNPLRHYAEVLRGVVLRGAGIVDLQRPLLALLAIGILVFSIAVSRFGKSVG